MPTNKAATNQMAETVLRAFSADHVVRLTGLTKWQLAYWDKTGFFQPQFANEDRRGAYSRVYSFRDVVGLRTLAVLRNRYGISLQHLREVGAKLSHLKEDLWTKQTLYVHNKEVCFDEPETGKTRGVVSGQFVSIPLVRIVDDVSDAIAKLRERKQDSTGKVERHRHVARNAWVVAGTRIPIRSIVEFKEAGYSTNKILKEFPTLTRADVAAAIKYEKRLKRA